MAQSDQKLVTPLSLVVDVILVGAFFLFMFSLLKIHVPSNDSTYVTLWGGLAASCMSAVFWLAVQMFRVVFRAQRLAAKR